MKVLGVVFGFACAASAQVQNTDISFMLGPVSTSAAIVNNVDGSVSTFTGSVGISNQFNYGYQVLATGAGNLYIETPITFIFRGTGTVTTSPPGGLVASIDRNATYFTPGVRFKIPTGSRVSLYAVAGIGTGIYGERDAVVNNQLVASTDNTTVHLSGDVGGGIDFRISRSFSLRAEERDFISPKGLGGTAGHNHLQFLAGFALHF